MKAFFVVRKAIAHSGIVPRWWRLAWYEPRRRVGIYSPWPLHWILRFSRELFHRTLCALTGPSIERRETLEIERAHERRQLLAEEYSRGYLAGWRECLDAWVQSVPDGLASPDEFLNRGPLLAGSPFDKLEN